MSPAFCRRQFLTRSLLLAGAAVLLPIGRLSAAADSTSGATPNDADTDAVLRMVRGYSDRVEFTTTGATVRLTAQVRSIDALQRTLSGARDHGIAQVRSAGNLVTFELGGRRFEVENVFHAV